MSDTTSGLAGGSSIITPELVALDSDLGADKNSVIAALAGRLVPASLAAHQIALNIAGFTFMVPLGVSS